MADILTNLFALKLFKNKNEVLGKTNLHSIFMNWIYEKKMYGDKFFSQ